MKTVLKFFFDKWWIPVILCIFALVLYFISERYIHNSAFDTFNLVFFGFTFLCLLTSFVVQLFKRKWLGAVLTGISLCIVIGFVFVYIVFHVMFLFFRETVDGDKWADNLEIPTDIPLEYPIYLTFENGERPDSILSLTRTKIDLQLYNSFQAGLYEYDFWSGRIEEGTIYLKAYEITQGTALSTDRLVGRSSVRVNNPTDSIIRFVTTSDFTIYEGDWGQPYAARFEVWFRPDSIGQERKLIEKNYIIEGWQR